MDFIPFEKVSIQEAKAVLDGISTTTPSRPLKNWALLRATNNPNNSELTERAWQWLDQLPAPVQPGALVQQFPRITNKLAELWSTPHDCEKYLDTLMLDHRDGRKGFPPEIAMEIAHLKIHFTDHVMQHKFGAWDEGSEW